MLALAVAAAFTVVVLVVQWRATRLVRRYDVALEPPAVVTGGEAAARLLERAGVSVPVIEGDIDCYSLRDDGQPRPHIQLAEGRLGRRSLSAVAIAAHEAAHAIQHASGWWFFRVDLVLAVTAFFAGPIGIACPVGRRRRGRRRWIVGWMRRRWWWRRRRRRLTSPAPAAPLANPA